MNLLSEVIVVNDGSIDNTQYEAERANVTIINLKRNMGKAAALKIGFTNSQYRTILTIDADGSHQAPEIKEIIRNYYQNKVDMLIGSRFLNERKKRVTSPMNIVGNKISSLMLFFLFRQKITDPLSGLRIFRKEVIDLITIRSQGFEIESEITTKALIRGFKIKEIPISTKSRIYGPSHLNSLFDGFKIVKSIIFSYILKDYDKKRKNSSVI